MQQRPEGLAYCAELLPPKKSCRPKETPSARAGLCRSKGLDIKHKESKMKTAVLQSEIQKKLSPLGEILRVNKFYKHNFI